MATPGRGSNASMGQTVEPALAVEMVEVVVSSSIRGRLASDALAINVSGFGFNASSSTYQCLLTLANATNCLSFPCNISAPISPETSQLVLCPPLQWPFAVEALRAELLHDGLPVANALRSSFSLLETWRALEPSSILASGALVTVLGRGFVPDGNYSCRYTQDGQTVAAPLDAVLGPSALTCRVPVWLDIAGEGRLALLKGEDQVVFEGAAGRLRIEEVAVAVEPSTGLSTGGQPLEVRGYGFTPTTMGGLDQYVALFGEGMAVGSGGGCKSVNSTLILCSSVEWFQPGGLYNLTLAHIRYPANASLSNSSASAMMMTSILSSTPVPASTISSSSTSNLTTSSFMTNSTNGSSALNASMFVDDGISLLAHPLPFLFLPILLPGTIPRAAGAGSFTAVTVAGRGFQPGAAAATYTCTLSLLPPPGSNLNATAVTSG
eukprot:413866-Rhodomonas_salina.1